LGDERLESPFLKPRTREQWLEQGSPKVVQSAKDRARTILKEHLPRRLALEAGAELREIIGLARQDLGCNVGVDT
jgi:trimethylamine:corrinoid methyltransferase-like protein